MSSSELWRVCRSVNAMFELAEPAQQRRDPVRSWASKLYSISLPPDFQFDAAICEGRRDRGQRL
jgi:hypothetical protein